VLDAGERRRAAAYRDEATRRRFVVSHAALRHIAGPWLGVAPAALRWTVGPHGKPELPGLHVNLSHSGGLALVAACAARPVGVDIQQIVPGLDVAAMARRYYPPDEAAHVGTGEGAAERFAVLWARKEALVKAAGGRLTQALPVPVLGRDVVEYLGNAGRTGRYRLADVAAPEGFRAAVAVVGEDEVLVEAGVWTAPAGAETAEIAELVVRVAAAEAGGAGGIGEAAVPVVLADGSVLGIGRFAAPAPPGVVAPRSAPDDGPLTVSSPAPAGPGPAPAAP
jgi:4'-phosphopantetheinyl transferase